MNSAVEHVTIAGRISENLVARRLPRKQPTAIWVGHGTGKPCDGCDAEIFPEMLEHEYESEGALLRLHADCAKIWLAMVNYAVARASTSQTT